MRHRFHALCPYFAMFPESFVEKHLAASTSNGVVFDPFCGRGTAIFQSLLEGREAAGCDVNPVAYVISRAKCDPPTRKSVLNRLRNLSIKYKKEEPKDSPTEMRDFMELCFHKYTRQQIFFLRDVLDWKNSRVDRFISAMALGALHGESHRSENYFSNRMPRTISNKPAIYVRC